MSRRAKAAPQSQEGGGGPEKGRLPAPAYDPQKDGIESYNVWIAANRAKLLAEKCPAVRRVEVIGGCELYLGDCMEIMPALAPVDHVISDPPYEDELHKAVGRVRRSDGRKMITDLGFSGVNARRAEIVKSVVRISKGWAILFTLAEGVRSWRDELQACGAKYDTCLAWIKPDSMPRMNGQGAARGFECAVTAWCGDGYRSWNGGGKRGVYTHLTNHRDRDGRHPTEKPLPLMVELIGDFTQPEQTVLDPFMGSGTTGVACVRAGRRFIGIELDDGFFDIACQRIRKAYAQPDLFVAALKPPEEKQIGLGLEGGNG
jgi:site-specific DNA-methyltransferase (adenine-specific)